MVRWYKFLNKGEGNNYNVLLNSSVPDPEKLIVCQELEFRKFAQFSNIYNFSNFLLGEVLPNKRCFYEYIFDELPQKPYFDLDIPITPPKELDFVPKLGNKIPDKKPSFSLTIEEASKALMLLLECIKKVFPKIKNKDILIFNSHGPKKRSYHVIIDNWCFTNSQGNRNFFNKILEHYPDKFKQALDSTMYKSIQAFRIYLCHKYESDRVKTLDPISLWESNNKEDVSDDFKILEGSLVTNTGYCEILPNFGDIVEKKTFNWDDIHFEDTEIFEALNICARYEKCTSYESKDFPYALKEVKGGLILLKRLRPSYCFLCKRTHDKQDPYLVIKQTDNSVHFGCRRNEHEGTLLLIGKIKKVECDICDKNICNKDIISVKERDILGEMNVIKGPKFNRPINMYDKMNFSIEFSKRENFNFRLYN